MLTSVLIVLIMVPEHLSLSAVLAAATLLEAAKASLSQCVHVRKDDAVGFAFLCDELAAAVEARSLAEPLVGWLQLQLQPMLSQLVVQGSPADAQVSFTLKGLSCTAAAEAQSSGPSAHCTCACLYRRLGVRPCRANFGSMTAAQRTGTFPSCNSSLPQILQNGELAANTLYHSCPYSLVCLTHPAALQPMACALRAITAGGPAPAVVPNSSSSRSSSTAPPCLQGYAPDNVLPCTSLLCPPAIAEQPALSGCAAGRTFSHVQCRAAAA